VINLNPENGNDLSGKIVLNNFALSETLTNTKTPWSAGLAYKDVNDVMKNGRQEEIQLLMGYFNGAWTTV
jgi:hypothetical protein